MFSSSTKREFRHFHVVVGQRRQRNVQKSLMRVQSCCFANKTYCFFALSSKSQFVPTRKHTNLGCGSLQAKRCPNRAVENGKSENNKRNCVYHQLATPRPPTGRISKTDQYRDGGFSPSCCSTTPFQLAYDLVLWNCMLLGLYITFL